MEEPKDAPSDTTGKLPADSNKESIPKSLSDMPIDVVEQVVGWSDYKEELILKKVCKSMRSIIDELVPSCKSVEIKFRKNHTLCQYNDQKVIYASKSDGFYYFREEFKDVHLVKKCSFKSVAFDDLVSTLNNPKLQLNHFYFEQNAGFAEFKNIREQDIWIDESYDKIENLLKSLNQQLSIKQFKLLVTNPSNIRQLLPYFKAGKLEKIILRRTHSNSWDNPRSLEIIKEIAEMEQWKQAVELELHHLKEFPMDYASHFKRFTIRFNIFPVDTFSRLAEFFSKFANFERCLLEEDHIYGPRYINWTAVGVRAPPNELTQHVRHFPIPDSDDYLEFLIFGKSVLIEKRKRSA